MSFEEIDLQWFAAEDEGRTEEPSEFKLQKARKEGRVPKSQELNSSLVLIVVMLILAFSANYILDRCENILVFFFTRCNEEIFQANYYSAFIRVFMRLILPLAAGGIVAAFLANIIQNRGFIFSTKPIEPKFSKIAPKFGQYLKKTVFSMEGLFNTAKSLAKVCAIAIVAFNIIKSNLPVILGFLNASSVRLAIGKIASTALQIVISCAVIFLVISVLDYVMQRRQFMETMKMTKQEVKQEYKEMEGDPEVKSRLEQSQRQLLQQNMPRAVAESDVVITNPTHFAVALKYDSLKADSPQVSAKGADEVAFRIREIAKENEVPVVENRPLARALYAETEVGDIIPEHYIKAIVAVYTQIDYLNKKK